MTPRHASPVVRRSWATVRTVTSIASRTTAIMTPSAIPSARETTRAIKARGWLRSIGGSADAATRASEIGEDWPCIAQVNRCRKFRKSAGRRQPAAGATRRFGDRDRLLRHVSRRHSVRQPRRQHPVGRAHAHFNHRGRSDPPHLQHVRQPDKRRPAEVAARLAENNDGLRLVTVGACSRSALDRDA